MGQFAASLEEDRFLVSYSFLRMMLLLLGGALVNALVLSYFGLVVRFGVLTFATDWRILVTWVAAYPVLWAVLVTYSLPVKLRGSPFDLAIATTLILPATYILSGQSFTNIIPLTAFTGLLIITSSLLQGFLVSPIVGLGKAGGLPYHYDSFLFKDKKVTDFARVYESEQYRNWLSLPNHEITTEKDGLNPVRIVLSTARFDELGTFVFFSNQHDGLLVQVVSFEKGKYSIFKSKDAVFYAEQMKKVIQWELHSPHPIFRVVEAEREAAEYRALRVTRSIVSLRGVRTRDRIVLAGGAGLLTLEYFLWVFGVITSTDSYATVSILTLFGVIAELSYRRLKQTDLWSGLTRQSPHPEYPEKRSMSKVWKRLQDRHEQEPDS